MARFRATRVPSFGITFALVLSISACSGTPVVNPTNGPGAPGPTSGEAGSMIPSGDVGAARQILEATDLANPETVRAVEQVRFTEAGQEAARAVLTSSPSGDVLWAATWIYATSGTDPSVLAPVMSNEDPTLRALAGAALLSWGRPEAARVLVDLLSASGYLTGGEPPLLISDFAAYSLARYIEGPTADATASLADITAAWTSWLAANGAAMDFDAETGKWVAR